MSRAHLTPRAPTGLQWIQPFVDVGVLNAVDLGFAQLVHQNLADRSIRPADQRMVVLAAALAARAPQRGHVAVDLAQVAATAAVDSPPLRSQSGDIPGLTVADLPWPDPTKWVKTLQTQLDKGRLDGIVRGPQAPLGLGLPVELMVYDRGLLYLERYYSYEFSVKKALSDLAGSQTLPASLSNAAARDTLDELFEDSGPQRAAAEHAISHRLTVIAGGPGTGKTYTLTRVLAALLSADPQPRIGLAAPTGKAASRMKDAIGEATDELDSGLAETLRGVEASTIHRMLGWNDGIRFRHNRSNPLPFDVVVIDEVSMVSLPLMGRLVEAIGPSTRVILVGDPYQLASVEAGAVLGDITGSTGRVAQSVRTLTDARRFTTDSGIAVMAEAIRHGDADRVVEVLDSPAFADVERLDPDQTHELLNSTIASGVEAMHAALDGDAKKALALGSATKFLCATRRGDNGRDEWQKRIETGVRSLVDNYHFRGRWYVGRPIIATSNDYVLRLFNGDTGVVVKSANGRMVVFPDADNSEPLNPAQIGEFDTWWAMTIHKSQGSEFPHAVVALPEPGSPILTRELLYTGVTRAKNQVTVIATEAAVREAVSTRIRRASGLARMLS